MEVIRSCDTSAGVVDVEVEECEGDEEAGGEEADLQSAGQPSSGSSGVEQQQNGTGPTNGLQQQQARQQQQSQQPSQEVPAGRSSTSEPAAVDALADATAEKLAV